MKENLHLKVEALVKKAHEKAHPERAARVTWGGF
jgi:hypothetical protein